MGIRFAGSLRGITGFGCLLLNKIHSGNKRKEPHNHIINRTGDTGAILEKVSTEWFRPDAAGYHYR